MSTARVLAYGLLGLPLAFAALPVYVHVPRYYAETTGISLALLGGILLAARLLDAGIDPLLGWLADRVARPVMVAVALLPFAVGFVALLNLPEGFPAMWLLASLVFTYLGFSAASSPAKPGARMSVPTPHAHAADGGSGGFGLLGV
jgi:Na+/melibiose symporter-like transporter